MQLQCAFFARDYPDESSSTTGDSQCVYSYAIAGEHNEFNFCLAPQIRVQINNNRRDVGFGVQDDDWHHYCFTWSDVNGDYVFYIDGVSVSSGAGFVRDGHISYGGTTVIGQDQDSVGGDFVAAQAFVGDLTQVNVWNKVLPESDIQAQASTCHISEGTQVIKWSQFKDKVQGGVVLMRP
ncbi:Neuronal pentraxin-1 [Desmophyllum pertusum]|uniref:Pentraxin family member n=1 Tax=Desmophyllum pertusum TaxID=174260 RepID=A0A9W9Z1M0_9CNID|nr:Neuronal pentraxin-1 [Desmophyllum pertusum]